jgi:8-oxo-dGTP pyrophosphatase MutT (NUDIX family)
MSDPANPDRRDLPAWLVPLVRAARSATAADFVRQGPAVPPPGGRPSAVLILVGAGAAGPDVLLIERAEQLRSHAGQPAFPGGAADPGDRGPADTALREAAEEVGLDRSGVRVVALLPELFLPPTGFVVTPVLGWWHRPAPVRVVDVAEVARVERVPVAELVDPANRCRVRHPSGYTGPAFTVRGMTVWGFTAGLLDRMLELAGWAVPWDTDDVRDLPQRALDLAARGLPAGYRLPPSDRPAAEHDGPAADDVIPRTGRHPMDHAEHTEPPGTVER